MLVYTHVIHAYTYNFPYSPVPYPGTWTCACLSGQRKSEQGNTGEKSPILCGYRLFCNTHVISMYYMCIAICLLYTRKQPCVPGASRLSKGVFPYGENRSISFAFTDISIIFQFSFQPGNFSYDLSLLPVPSLIRNTEAKEAYQVLYNNIFRPYDFCYGIQCSSI